tara:strand:- start:545 stop:853 length:309 start_codon:yes stop_codon:yes gene_type:complete
MRKQVAKKINKKVTELLISWIQTIVPEDEQHKVTPKNYATLLPKEEYLQTEKTFYLSMYTKRWAKQNIKKLLKSGYSLNNITIGDLEWLTKTRLKTDRLNIL